MDIQKSYILSIISNSLYLLRDLGLLTQKDVKEITEIIFVAVNTHKKQHVDTPQEEIKQTHRYATSQEEWENEFTKK